MKTVILEIAEKLKYDEITTDDAKNQLLSLFCLSDWTYVNEQEPPILIELLAKSPNGDVQICSWRDAYKIFTVQCKYENALDWQWKLL